MSSNEHNEIPPLIEASLLEEKEKVNIIDYITPETYKIVWGWNRPERHQFLQVAAYSIKNNNGILSFWVCNSNPCQHTLTIFLDDEDDDCGPYSIKIEGAIEIEQLVQSFVGYSNWSLLNSHNRSCHLETDPEILCHYCGILFK